MSKNSRRDEGQSVGKDSEKTDAKKLKLENRKNRLIAQQGIILYR